MGLLLILSSGLSYDLLNKNKSSAPRFLCIYTLSRCWVVLYDYSLKNISTMDSKFYFPYLAPDVEVLSIAVEAGFANSMEDPYEDAEQEW